MQILSKRFAGKAVLDKAPLNYGVIQAKSNLLVKQIRAYHIAMNQTSTKPKPGNKTGQGNSGQAKDRDCMNPLKQSKYLPLLLLIIALLALLAGSVLIVKFRSEESRVQAANALYASGEVAKTIDARQKAFNQALDLYLALEHDYHPSFGNGRLYYNIGNTYYQLGQYPWAILYYERALALAPRDERVRQNLVLAQEKLSLPHAEPINAFATLFAWHSNLSLPERLQLFFVCGMISLLFCSRLYLEAKGLGKKRGDLVPFNFSHVAA